MLVPEVAARLRQLAVELNCPELSRLADELRRRPSGPKAPNSSRSMTPGLASQIRALKATQPALSQAEIGRQLNVNPGRVSEVLRGKRQ